MSTTKDNLESKSGSRMDAGTADRWHIHKDHIKYGSNEKTRVDFSGRTNAKIMDKIAEKSDLYSKLQSDPLDVQTYNDCINWINTYY